MNTPPTEPRLRKTTVLRPALAKPYRHQMKSRARGLQGIARTWFGAITDVLVPKQKSARRAKTLPGWVGSHETWAGSSEPKEGPWRMTMTRTLAMLVVAALTISGAAFAQQTPPPAPAANAAPKEGSVNDRRADQQQRIANGVQS